MTATAQFRPLGIQSSIKVSATEFSEQIKYDPTVSNTIGDTKEWMTYVRKYMASSVTAGDTKNNDDDYTSDI